MNRHVAVAAALIAVVCGCSSAGPTSTVPQSVAPTDSTPTASSLPTATPVPTGTRSSEPTATTQPTPTLKSSPTPSSTPTSSPSAAAAWHQVEVADGPSARSDHTFTVDGDGSAAFVFGGTGPDGALGDLWRLDLASLSWDRLTPEGDGPAARFGHVASWVDGVGLVVWSGQGDSGFFNDLWAYDPAANRWLRLPDDGQVPAARYGSCGAIGPDGRLWISHGFTGTGRFDDTRAYDFTTQRWAEIVVTGERPIKRCLHDCLWSPSGDFLLYAGQTDGVPALSDLWSLDPTSGSWTQAPEPLPEARQLYALASAGSTAYVFGGASSDRQPLDSQFTLDLTTLDWHAEEASGPTARSGATLIARPGGGLLLFGGSATDGPLADLWELRVDS